MFCWISLPIQSLSACIVIFRWEINATVWDWVKDWGAWRERKEGRRKDKTARWWVMSVREWLWKEKKRQGRSGKWTSSRKRGKLSRKEEIQKFNKGDRFSKLEKTDALRAICVPWGKVTGGQSLLQLFHACKRWTPPSSPCFPDLIFYLSETSDTAIWNSLSQCKVQHREHKELQVA